MQARVIGVTVVEVKSLHAYGGILRSPEWVTCGSNLPVIRESLVHNLGVSRKLPTRKL